MLYARTPLCRGINQASMNVVRSSNVRSYRPLNLSPRPHPSVQSLPYKKLEDSHDILIGADNIDPVDQLLTKPTWSVQTLAHGPEPSTDELSHSDLLHLLQLSALPQPISQYHSNIFRNELISHLKFVRDVQSVNTEGLEPLVCIRNETEEGVRDNTIGLGDLKEALSKEYVQGKCSRPRRKSRDAYKSENNDWDLFHASKNTVTVNGEKYFIVRHGAPRSFKSDGIDLKDHDTITLN